MTNVVNEGANLIGKLSALLPHEGFRAFDTTVRMAEEARSPLYLAGGSLRDLLLSRPIVDIDLVCEGDAPSLARRVAQALEARCVVHSAFATATVIAGDFAFDIATARSETYQRPGALPRVRLANLAEDLARRDFTINAMALALTGDQRGTLIDPNDGQGDLARRLIRVLHDLSFVDDATRILRAVRYEARLDFRIEEHTLGLLRRDVGCLQTIGGARLRRELVLILEEAEPERALQRAQELGALAAIHPALTFDDRLAAAFVAARREVAFGKHLRASALPLVYLSLLASHWSEAEAAALSKRLSLAKHQRQAVEAMPRLRSFTGKLAVENILPSEVVAVLSPFPEAAIWAFSLIADRPPDQERAKRYLKIWRYVKSHLAGPALLALGVPTGPEIGKMLKRLRTARLDGVVGSRDEEIAFVRNAQARSPRAT